MFAGSGQPDTDLSSGTCVDCPTGTTSGSGKYVQGGDVCVAVPTDAPTGAPTGAPTVAPTDAPTAADDFSGAESISAGIFTGVIVGALASTGIAYFA
jgi:hypothetical protein